MLPNVAEPLLLTLMLTMGDALLALAGLSLLGVGVQPPSYDWGGMLTEGIQRIYVTPIVVVGPAVAIIFAALGFNLLGESLAKGGTAGRDPPAASGRPSFLRPSSMTERGAGRRPRETVLDVRGLSVAFPGGSVPVRDVSITVEPGEIVGIVGESGSGKSLTAMAIAELLPVRAQATTVRRLLFGHDLGSLGNAARRRLLGRSLSIVYQDPMASLNPALRVDRQLGEVAEVHEGLSRREARKRSVERLRSVRIGSPERRARNYPHELSGGMRQRVMIAMGLMGSPQLIIADEPTTALDVTVQQQIIKLLDDVAPRRGRRRSSSRTTSRSFPAVPARARDVRGPHCRGARRATLVRQPAHPYTAALLASVPTMETDRDRPFVSIPGRAAGPFDHSPGCPFAPRCPAASERCQGASGADAAGERPPGRLLAPELGCAAAWIPADDKLEDALA